MRCRVSVPLLRFSTLDSHVVARSSYVSIVLLVGHPLAAKDACESGTLGCDVDGTIHLPHDVTNDLRSVRYPSGFVVQLGEELRPWISKLRVEITGQSLTNPLKEVGCGDAERFGNVEQPLMKDAAAPVLHVHQHVA